MDDFDATVGGDLPEVPDFAEMRRSMEQAKRRHILEGMSCLRPSCDGVLEFEDAMVSCSDCDYRVDVGRTSRSSRRYSGSNAAPPAGRTMLRDL